MIWRSRTWLGLMLVWSALGAPVEVEAQQDQSATADQPAIEEPPATEEAPTPAAMAPSAVALRVAAPCSTACPTAPSSIDDRDHSDTGWLIIGIGGSVAASSLALGASLMAQADTNAESRVGSATLAAGITGIAVSLLVGLIAM
jgi:hypothetical protein